MANTQKNKVTVKKGKPSQQPEDMSSYAIKVENPRNINNLYTTEFSGLSPASLHRYLEVARKGLLFFKSLLFEEIRRRDLRIGGICQTRKLSVANKEWELSFKKESVIPEATQEEMKSFINECLLSIDFTNFITDIVEAQIQGVSTFEIIYKPEGSKIVLDNVNYIPNYLLCFDDQEDTYKYLDHTKADTMKLRTLGWSALQDRINLEGLTLPALDPMKLIEVHSLDGNSQNGFLNGCIDSLIWGFLFKNYGLKDWSIYIERFAIPSVIGKYPPLMSQTDRNKLETAVEKFGHLFRMLIPAGAEMDVLSDTSKGATKDAFDNYIAYWNKELTIRVLGQSLTTDIGNVGSKAASQTHDEVRRDIMVSDMLLVKRAVNKLVRNLIKLNYGDQPEYITFSFEEEEDIEYKTKRSEIFKNLRLTGYRVSQEDIENEFGVSVEIAHTPGAAAEEPPAGAAKTEGTEGTDKYINKFIEEYWNGLH